MRTLFQVVVLSLAVIAGTIASEFVFVSNDTHTTDIPVVQQPHDLVAGQSVVGRSHDRHTMPTEGLPDDS